MAEIFKQEHLSQVRVPMKSDPVYKDECMYSFDSPYSKDGLYVSLHNFMGFGHDYVMLDHQKSKRAVSYYLNIKKIPKEKKEEPKEETHTEKKPRILGIGIEGGFEVEPPKTEYTEIETFVILPQMERFPLPDNTLPMVINLAIEGIKLSESSMRKEDVAMWTAEKRQISKFADNLQQLDNGVKVPPRGWMCSKCDLKENLWMNLSDGAILCGRRNWDGSGGNGHALEHYQKTGHPLCVKLGTISGDGQIDIFSYAEDEMVEVPKIKQYLRHFGINAEGMQKTEKSIAELELDQNLQYEFNRLQESGKELQPVYGPGYTGMCNIGSSCYLASVMQTVFTVPHFIRHYVQQADNIFQNSNDPVNDYNLQMAKLGYGLCSGKYSSADLRSDFDGLPPKRFKALVGKGHPEFSTMKQQDAMEFFQHLLEFIDRKERAAGSNNSPTIAFKFQLEERIECQISKKVKYSSKVDNILSLPVPLESASNQNEVKAYQAAIKNLDQSEKNKIEVVRPKISLESCLQAFASEELIDDFYSSETKMKGHAIKRTRLGTFPPYLMIQIRKFTLGDDWVPKKLDVSLEIPDYLDINWIRGKGLQPGEQLLPEESAASSSSTPAAPAVPEIELNQEIVMQLAEMGFDVEGCKKAVYHTKNAGVEPAMNWVLEHMGDADFTAPFSPPKQQTQPVSNQASAPVNEEAIQMLESMGFNRKKALKALKETNNNLERAADWLFSRMDEDIDEDEAKNINQPAVAKPSEHVEDGAGQYRLKGIISHMGSNTSSGHYVCHLLRDGKWVLYNDSKVAFSDDPPKDLGYLYLYERI